MIAKSTIVFLALLALCFLAAFAHLPLAYMVCFVSFFYVTLWLLFINVMWLALPRPARQHYQRHRLAFVIASLFCCLFIALGKYLIDDIYFTHSSAGLRVGAKIVFLAIALLWSWAFLSRRNQRISYCVLLAFVLALLLAPVFVLTQHRDASDSQSAAPTDLHSLPYIGWTPAADTIDKIGVTGHDPNLAYPGLNLYTERTSGKALLMDMDGRILHRWTLPGDGAYEWPYVELCPDGDLLALAIDAQICRLDWNSQLLWQLPLRVHHDFYHAEDGDIYVLAHQDDIVFAGCLPIPIVHDYLAVLDPQGKLKRQISLYEPLQDLITTDHILPLHRNIIRPRRFLDLITWRFTHGHMFGNRSIFDIMHSNSVEIITRDIPGLGPQGSLLISMRQPDLIAVIGPDESSLLWHWGPGNLQKPHHPTLLDNGNILIYDNGDLRPCSRIIELDPVARKIVWQYQADPPERFFSATRGSNQRLPNGNTLITETTKGRIFEVTPDGRTVWEFFNPNITDDDPPQREVIYRALRITNPPDYPILAELARP